MFLSRLIISFLAVFGVVFAWTCFTRTEPSSVAVLLELGPEGNKVTAGLVLMQALLLGLSLRALGSRCACAGVRAGCGFGAIAIALGWGQIGASDSAGVSLAASLGLLGCSLAGTVVLALIVVRHLLDARKADSSSS